MSSSAVLTRQLGWTWTLIGSGSLLHLVPSSDRPGSRTACGLVVKSRWDPLTVGRDACCSRCLARNGGVA